MISAKWFEGSCDLSDAFNIRRAVFIEEQEISEALEFDEDDFTASHLVVYDGALPVACGRLVVKSNVFFIGRIAVLKEQRGKKYGDFLVRLLIRKSFDLGADEVFVNAQVQAVGFYKKLGFLPLGDIFDDAGIDHIKMVRSEDISGCCS